MERNIFTENREKRFSFIFSVNENIIVRRDFWINNFNERSLGSQALIDAIDECADLINADLKSKTNIYLSYTAPQVFANKEEMDKWVKKPTFHLEHPTFVVLRDSDETFTWNGEEMLPYGKQFNRSDYVEAPNQPCVFKLAFLDYGKEVHSLQWDGSVYPKFIRTNIDISNSSNKFKKEGVYAPMEAFLTDIFNETHDDLIPQIVKRIYAACSGSGSYNYFVDWGGKKYSLNIAKEQEDYIKKIEASCRKRTEKYFKEIDY